PPGAARLPSTPLFRSGRLDLAHRSIRQLPNPIPAKPLHAFGVQNGVLRVDVAPERVRVANRQGSEPYAIVVGLRRLLEERRHLRSEAHTSALQSREQL